MAKIYVESELYHYGRKGQKWGEHIFTDKNGKVYRMSNGKKGSKATEEKRRYFKTGKGTLDSKTFNALQYKSKKVADLNKKDDTPKSDKPSKPKLNKDILKDVKSVKDNQPKTEETKKDLSEMSDADLNKAVNRKKKEKEYKDLYEPDITGQNMKTTKTIADESAKIMNTTKQVVDRIPVKKQRMDLSEMSDKELQDRINRELKERQYNDLFAQPSKAEKGKQIASGILAGAGAALAVTSSALSIALALRELKKK